MRPLVTCLPLAVGLFVVSAAAAQTPESASPSTAAPAPAAEPTAARSEAPRTYVDSASVEVSGKADLNGTIQLEFTPFGAPSKLVQVNVLKKTGRKDIAKDLHKELTIAAGSLYKVKLSGDTVKISKLKGAQNFSILLEKLDLSGVAVLVKKG